MNYLICGQTRFDLMCGLIWAFYFHIYVICKFFIMFPYHDMVCREHKGVLEDLDKAQVDILHVGSNRKNAADDKLKQLMRRW